MVQELWTTVNENIHFNDNRQRCGAVYLARLPLGRRDMGNARITSQHQPCPHGHVWDVCLLVGWCPDDEVTARAYIQTGYGGFVTR